MADAATQSANNAATLANEKANYADEQGDYAKGIGNTVAVNETDRINAETIRLDNETDRINAELSRETSEAGRNQAENARQSSETARSEAEILREQAKTATIAATTAANTAAETANNAKGWSPVTEFETYVDKQLKKLIGYIGGTGDAPTDNIDLYFAAGGFTSDKDLAIDFKGSIGETVVNVNPSSTISQVRIWLGTRDEYDVQQPLASDLLTITKQ